MVVLIASKMVLLALTFPFFTLTSLVSLQIFHGVWTIAFFCLTILDSRARLLPNASCLLAGYLPATPALHHHGRDDHPAGHPHHVCSPAHGVHPDSCRGRGDVAAAACCSSQRGRHKLNGIVKRSFKSAGTA